MCATSDTYKQTSSLKCEFILSQLALPSLIVGFRKWLLAILCCTIKHINFALLEKPNLTKNCIDKAKNQTNTSLPPCFLLLCFNVYIIILLQHHVVVIICLGPLIKIVTITTKHSMCGVTSTDCLA